MKLPPTLRVLALQKSGHHAVIAWLARALGCRVTHRDNCQAVAGGLVATETHEYHGPLAGHVTIESCEEISPARFLEISLHLPPATTIVVLRDPWNCYASRLAHLDRLGVTSPAKRAHYLDLGHWLRHAAEFGYASSTLSPVLPIKFNHWHADPRYRELWFRISFGRVPHVDDRNDVASVYGSSFDGHRFARRASEMDVLNRHRLVEDREEYQALRWDDVRDVAAPYFPEVARHAR